MNSTSNRGRPVEVALEDVLAYLDERTAPFFTADDVAERFQCSDQTARNKLGVLVDGQKLSSVSLGPGKPQLYFKPDYEAATQAIDILRKHLDIKSINHDRLADFADEPYCLLPKADNEAYVVVPQFVPFHVGWLDRKTVSHNIFIVNKFVDWIDELPEDIRAQVGIEAKYDHAVVADDHLDISSNQRDEAWEEFATDRHEDAIPGDAMLAEMDWDRMRSLAR